MRLASGIKQQNGSVRFDVAAPGLSCAIIASKVEEKKNANGPDWELFHCGARCGALWKTTPKNGGDEYLEGNLESPIFPEGRVRVAVFKSRIPEKKGQWEMVWSPPRGGSRRDDAGDESRSMGGETSAPSQPADDDEDIPF